MLFLQIRASCMTQRFVTFISHAEYCLVKSEKNINFSLTSAYGSKESNIISKPF